MIRRITIQGFRSLKNVTVDFSPVTVLVGKSGTGKTNFVTAVRLLRDYLIQGTGCFANFGGDNHIFPVGEAKPQLMFEVEFSIAGIDRVFRYHLRLPFPPSQGHVQEESLTLDSETLFHQSQGRWQVAPAVVPAPSAGPLVISRLPGIPDAVIAYTALTAGIGCYSFPLNVFTKPTQNPRVEQSGFWDNAGNYLQCLKDIVSDLKNLHIKKSLVTAIQQLNETVSAVELNALQNPQAVIVGAPIGWEHDSARA